MSSNNKLKVSLFLTVLCFLVGCSKDLSTPTEKKSSTYLQRGMHASSQVTTMCNGMSVVLPASQHGETVERYILKLHFANKGGMFSKLTIKELQSVYRDCVRPEIVNRL